MSLLFDENLSPRLSEALAELFPGSVHVHHCRLGAADDRSVWEHAKRNGLVLVSKDRDFYEMSLLHGPPPKIIWVRSGNASTKAIEGLFRHHARELGAFFSGEDTAFILA